MTTNKVTSLKIIIALLILITGIWFFVIRPLQHHPLILYGNVDIRDVNVAFRVGGRLTELLVDEGDKVIPGQILAHLDATPYIRELEAAEAVVEQKRAALAYTKTVFTRENKLAGTGASSTDRYQNAKSQLNQAAADLQKSIADLSLAALHFQDTALSSPSEGVILTRVVEPGTMLAANASVLTISLINPVWVRAYISEKELTYAKTGARVKVFADSLPDTVFHGKIGFVSPTAEFTPKTVETTELRTDLVYRLRIVMQDPKHQLRQGMPVTIKFDNTSGDK